MANKVVYGLSNVHYAVWDDEKGEYGAPVHVPGAVSFTTTREGNNDNFFADNVPYVTFMTNGGYTGDLELAYGPAQMLVDLVGYIKAENGMVLEDSNATAKTFALLFEIGSNTNPERCVFYNCTLSRPEMDANTTTDSTEPDTQSFELAAIPRALPWKGSTKNFVKGTLEYSEATKALYESFFETVVLPESTGAAA